MPPAPIPIAQRLKAETRSLHAQAERSGVMAELLAGRLGRGDYVALLQCLLALYETLEAAIDRQRQHAPLQALVPPALRRAPALRADLAAFEAPVLHRPLQAQELAQRIAQAAPHGLVAHAYVRYLGDLHGGQALRALVQRRFGLPEGAGTAFYDFGSPDAVLALRDRFRAGLSGLELDERQADDLVAEACWAFGAHCRMFDALSGAA